MKNRKIIITEEQAIKIKTLKEVEGLLETLNKGLEKISEMVDNVIEKTNNLTVNDVIFEKGKIKKSIFELERMENILKNMLDDLQEAADQLPSDDDYYMISSEISNFEEKADKIFEKINTYLEEYKKLED
jgi:uncharacterized protein YoxC